MVGRSRASDAVCRDLVRVLHNFSFLPTIALLDRISNLVLARKHAMVRCLPFVSSQCSPGRAYSSLLTPSRQRLTSSSQEALWRHARRLRRRVQRRRRRSPLAGKPLPSGPRPGRRRPSGRSRSTATHASPVLRLQEHQGAGRCRPQVFSGRWSFPATATEAHPPIQRRPRFRGRRHAGTIGIRRRVLWARADASVPASRHHPLPTCRPRLRPGASPGGRYGSRYRGARRPESGACVPLRPSLLRVTTVGPSYEEAPAVPQRTIT